MEQTVCSEMLAYKIQTPGNYPEESIQGLICFLSNVTVDLRALFSFLLYWYVLFLSVSFLTCPWFTKCYAPHLCFENKGIQFRPYYSILHLPSFILDSIRIYISHHIISYIVNNALEEFATSLLYAEDRGKKFVQNVGNFLCETGFEVLCDVDF
jgi:hypothetical protein